MTKAELRHRMRDVLRAVGAIAPADYNAGCARVHASVVREPHMRQARTVLLYAAVEPWGEIETAAMAGHLMALGKRLALPTVDARRTQPPAAAWIVNWDGDVIESGGIIRAPRPDLPLAHPHDIDLAIIPGLAFDLRGNRLGRGGGWYDRFLGMMRPDARRIGVCWEMQIVPDLPVEPHDVPMHTIVTEQRVIQVPPPRA